VLLWLPSIAAAQASLQVPLEFDFLSPGARSLALGSAFVALADDATSAFTNPAGLTILIAPEIAIEGRGRQIDTRFLERGRLSGTLTNTGIDTINGPQYATVRDTNFGAGFLSFVYPHKNRFAVAVYRHEVTNVSAQLRAQGVFQFSSGLGASVRETPLLADQQMDITNYGGSVAFRPTTKVSFGAGLSVYRLDFDSTYTRYVPFPFTAEANFAPSNSIFEGRLTGDDTAIGGSVGVLIMPRREFQVGISYRKAPSFTFEQSLRDLPSGTPTVTSGDFRVPDTFAAGAAVRPSDASTLSLEYRFVRYSQLQSYVDVQSTPSGRQAQFGIDDANEFHVGFEYALKVAGTPALRAGYWYDPAHSVTFDPHSPGDIVDERFSAYLPGSDNLSHVTFGAGVTFGPKFEINGGADLSSRRNIFSISAVGRF
jgi:long-subunit fatty acid transport protein